MTALPDRVLRGISSLGAPEMSLAELSAIACKYELDFLELRAVKGTTALPDYFRDHPEDMAAAVPVRVLATDLRLTEATDETIAAFLRYAELAETMQTPYLRVFGGGEWGSEITPGLFAKAVATVDRCRQLMTDRGLHSEILLETHSGFSSSKTCRRLNKLLAQPLGIIWDSHHTWKLAGESLEESWSNLGEWTHHIHYKDSLRDSSTEVGYRYVFPGDGEFPTQELLSLLQRVGYQGGLSLEWEKLWYPDLPEIAQVLPRFHSVTSSAG